VTVESLEEAPIIEGATLDTGNKFIVATLTVKNAAMQSSPMHSSIITAKLFDEDGSECKWHDMVKMSSADRLNMTMDAGAQVRMRLLFQAPLLAKAQRLVLRDQFSEYSVAVLAKKPEK
jgi:hypothetical protein